MGEAAKKEKARWDSANKWSKRVLMAGAAAGGTWGIVESYPAMLGIIDNPKIIGAAIAGGSVLAGFAVVLASSESDAKFKGARVIVGAGILTGSLVMALLPNEGYASKSDYDALKEKYAALAGTNTTTTTHPGQTTTSQPHSTEPQTSVASSQPSAPDKVINIPSGFPCSPVAGVVVEKGEGPWALIDRVLDEDTTALTGIFRANPALREMSLDAGDVVSITCG